MGCWARDQVSLLEQDSGKSTRGLLWALKKLDLDRYSWCTVSWQATASAALRTGCTVLIRPVTERAGSHEN